MGAPVDDAAALVNEPLVIQFAERLPDGTGAALVHSKARAVPVTGGTHLLLLLYNAVAVLFLPGPYALQELLPTQVIAGQALLTQVFLHLDLGGDSGVVRTGQPQGLISLHPLEANKNILQRGIHGVAHVQLPRDVGGRHHDGKRLFVRVRLRTEAAAVHPHLVDPGLHLPGIVHLG